MSENKSWLEEMHRTIKERNGVLTKEDHKNIKEQMKIPNDDISIEEVEFHHYHDYF
ncbi:hypothetical protein AGMMS49938_18730 [Fibrobacterales bacterium]|nr:hypothetical protein AGMMS49938_18730 [Fibrobacterales bacterium]